MKKSSTLFALLSFITNIITAQVSRDWVAAYNGPGGKYDMGLAIVTDNAGNVYVTGVSDSKKNADYATIKYNAAGVQQWVARYNGPGNGEDRAMKIAIDAAGNIYVTGRSLGSGTNLDYATVKYNNAGVQLWVARYNGPGNNIDETRAIVVDNSGNVYVTGFSTGVGTNTDYATVKYNSAGIQQWVRRYNGAANGRDEGISLDVDATGNVCVTGNVREIVSGSDCMTIKYDASGNILWSDRYIGGNGRCVKVDGNNNVYVTGWGDACTTIKYSPDGTRQWVGLYGAGTVSGAGYDLAIGTSGNVYVTGMTSEVSTDFATIKYSSDGIQQWAIGYDGPGHTIDLVRAVAIDASENVYITGFSEGAGGNMDFATIKYNSSGVQQWLQRFNGPGNSTDDSRAIALDANGNVYVTGATANRTNYDYATIKYSQVNTNLPVRSDMKMQAPVNIFSSQNYPNPFSGQTVISYNLAADTFVKLAVADNTGRELCILVNELKGRGLHQVVFNAGKFSSGIYYYRIAAGTEVQKGKIVLIR